jgi:uncharacterized membrane protein YfcA
MDDRFPFLPPRFWVAASIAIFPVAALAAAAPEVSAWWVWPIALFVTCFALGVVAVPAGVGGGVLFVPIVSGFFPFHLDFVRGAGLLVALASALASGPSLLRAGLADLRMALPLALVASISSIAGALIGLSLPAAGVETALGAIILCIAFWMMFARKSEFPETSTRDRLASALGFHGVYFDEARQRNVEWRAHQTLAGFVIFAGIGVMAGLFGLGAGWASVPTLNLVMGIPLRVSAGTSGFILSLATPPAVWVYFNAGALLAIIAVPSVLGMMLGAMVGTHVVKTARASVIRNLLIAILVFAGLRVLLKGLGAWA